MVNELGELLKLPNLDEETIKLINVKMREAINDMKPSAPAIQQTMDITVVEEWLNGTKEGGAIDGNG